MKNERVLSIALILLILQGVASFMGLMTWHKIGVVLIEVLALSQIFIQGQRMGSSKLLGIVFAYYVYIIINTILNFLGKDVSSFSTAMLEAIWWPSCFILFYTLVGGGYYIVNVSKKLSVFAWILIIVNFSFVLWNFLTFNVYIRDLGSNANLIFFITCLLPIFAFIPKNSIRDIIYAFVLIICILSLKRSAIISCVLVFIIDLLVEFRTSTRQKVVVLLLSAVVVFGLFSAVTFVQDSLGISVIDRFQSIENDGGSGRADIYPLVWNHFKEFPLLYKLIGHGQNMVVGDKICYGLGLGGNYLSAHNDFLEILYDFGIIGFILYLIFLYRVYKMTKKWRDINRVYYKVGLIGLTVTIVISMFGHLVIYSTYYSYIVSLWGIMESRRLTNNNI